DLVSWEWETAKRGGRARLDFTQNAINKTLVAPFSLRPAPGAPVSVPIRWDELDDPELRPDRWDLGDALPRPASGGAPLAPPMAPPAARLLHLLSLFTSRPRWSATELSERLGVTTRTVRRDIAELRDLGYPIESEPGRAGGYRLGAHGRLPPLLLTDDEAVAVAVGLRATATTGIADHEEAAVAAMAKLEQVLPGELRERVRALH